jgi:hypothetical protein
MNQDNPFVGIAAAMGATPHMYDEGDPPKDRWDQGIKPSPDGKAVAEFTDDPGEPYTLGYKVKTGRTVAFAAAADVRLAKTLIRTRILRSSTVSCRPRTGTSPRPHRPRAAGRARARAPGGDDSDPPQPSSLAWRRSADEDLHEANLVGDIRKQLDRAAQTAPRQKLDAQTGLEESPTTSEWRLLSRLQRIQQLVEEIDGLEEIEAVGLYVVARIQWMQRRRSR